MKKQIILILLFLLAGIQITFAQPAIETKARQAIVVDFETGTVLYEKNADEKMPTSSMSKVMTMYAVFDALKSGQLSLDDELLVSEKAWRKGGSKMFVEVDSRVKVEDLIRGVIIQSGNDATIVLAEALAASERDFGKRITKIAHELGMKNSNFVNASGWPDPDHYSTARDLSVLAYALVKNFPDYYSYYSEEEFTYSDITQSNRNPLLYRSDINADGVKTGHTEAAGYGLIGSGTHDDRRVIIVINGLENNKERAQESAKLLRWGLKSFANKTLFKANQVVDFAPVIYSQDDKVALIVERDVHVTIPNFAKKNMKVIAKFKEPLIAPVAAGSQIGTLNITIPYQDTMVIPLKAGTDVEKLGFFALSWEKVKTFLRNKAFQAG